MDTPVSSNGTQLAGRVARVRAAEAEARARSAGAWAAFALAVIAILPLTFVLMQHGGCYGSGPILLDAVAWFDPGDAGDCCAALSMTPPSPLARSFLGAEALWFIFAPVVIGLARILGWLRAREAAAVVAALVALHLATLGLGERSIGGAFMMIGIEAVVLAPFTYVPAWRVTVAFARAERRASALPHSSTGRRWALLAAALAAVGIPAWLFLTVAHGHLDAALPVLGTVELHRGCTIR